MGKKQEEPEAPMGAPEWVVTFTDMISLLVTFFVLLMTYSSMDPDMVMKVSSFLDTDTGVLETEPGDTAPDLSADELASNTDLRRGAENAHSRPPEALSENLEEMGQSLTEQHIELDLGQVADGIVIQFPEEASFDPGSDEVSLSLAKSLRELGGVLEHYSHLIVLEGHTDNRFRPTPDFPVSETLAARRAQAAAEVLLSESKLSPKLLQIAARGDSVPRVSNETAEGRQLNRRVEVRILSLSKTRSVALEAQRKKDRRGD